jgi:hypothetical protein
MTSSLSFSSLHGLMLVGHQARTRLTEAKAAEAALLEQQRAAREAAAAAVAAAADVSESAAAAAAAADSLAKAERALDASEKRNATCTYYDNVGGLCLAESSGAAESDTGRRKNEKDGSAAAKRPAGAAADPPVADAGRRLAREARVELSSRSAVQRSAERRQRASEDTLSVGASGVKDDDEGSTDSTDSTDYHVTADSGKDDEADEAMLAWRRWRRLGPLSLPSSSSSLERETSSSSLSSLASAAASVVSSVVGVLFEGDVSGCAPTAAEPGATAHAVARPVVKATPITPPRVSTRARVVGREEKSLLVAAATQPDNDKGHDGAVAGEFNDEFDCDDVNIDGDDEDDLRGILPHAHEWSPNRHEQWRQLCPPPLPSQREFLIDVEWTARLGGANANGDGTDSGGCTPVVFPVASLAACGVVSC